jgi:bacteriocin-like protein
MASSTRGKPSTKTSGTKKSGAVTPAKGKKGADIELTEDDLKKVSGGAMAMPVDKY